MLSNDVNALLSDKKKLLSEIYLDLQTFFEKKYGPDTVVFMSADPKISIQLLADALNTIAKSGLKDVRLI